MHCNVCGGSMLPHGDGKTWYCVDCGKEVIFNG